jgi:hypothetical protein
MSTNKQPWYHGVMFTFTATESMSHEEIQARLEKAFKTRPCVPGTVFIDELNEPEPGDPADLM